MNGNVFDYYLGPTGIPDKLRAAGRALNYLNPVNALGESMQASRRLFAPDTDGWGRVQATGDMLTGMAGVVAPSMVASRAGMSASNALQEGLMGFAYSPGVRMAADDAGRFVADESGAIRAWHGSPHDFDRFSMDKIGTGEGAQAYGHGLYFAESPGVANAYREQLSAQAGSGGRGRVRSFSTDGGEIPSARKAEADIAYTMQTYGIDPSTKEGADWLASELAARDMGGAIINENAVLDLFRGQPIRENWSDGRLYEVNIDANPEDFLDWDAPLSAQPEEAKVALRGFLDPTYGDGFFDEFAAAGNDLNDIHKNFDDTTPQQLTDALSGRGIPGIRYLDAGSRPPTYGPYVQDLINQSGSKERALEIARQRLASAPDVRSQIKAQEAIDALSIPETRNYVVFDDNMIDILGRDGSRNTPQGRAQNVLDYLTSGRASEVTDEMLEGADPQYLYRNYDMPMDEASRMARARDMGMDEGEFFKGMYPYDPETGPVRDWKGQVIDRADSVPQELQTIARPDPFPTFNRGAANDPDYQIAGVMGRDPSVANNFAAWGDASVYPLRANLGNSYVMDAAGARAGETHFFESGRPFRDAMRSGEYDSGLINNTLDEGDIAFMLRPENIRSRFARFDPRLAHLRNLSAGIGALGLFGDYDQRDNAFGSQ